MTQDLGLLQPHRGVRRDFPDKGLLTIIQAIQEFPVATIELIKGPGFDLDSIREGLIDELQGNLLLCGKRDLLGNVRFFRRTGSSAHSLGRYMRAPIRH